MISTCVILTKGSPTVFRLEWQETYVRISHAPLALLPAVHPLAAESRPLLCLTCNRARGLKLQLTPCFFFTLFRYAFVKRQKKMKLPTGSETDLWVAAAAAKQLCGSRQQTTDLRVSYRQWNLYEPQVTST